MHWSDIECAQPRLAGVGRARLIEPGVVLVATIRQDGTARISPGNTRQRNGHLRV
jgi:hypothetical protein